MVSPDGFTARDYFVKVMMEQDVEAANFFSPNGDMINDYWIVKDPELYENCEFVIYDASGLKVVEQTGYNNDWDGRYKGNELPDINKPENLHLYFFNRLFKFLNKKQLKSI